MLYNSVAGLIGLKWPFLRYSGQRLLDQVGYIKNGIRHRNPRCLQRRNLPLCGAGIAGDNRARVTHAFSRRSSASRDKSYYWLAHRLDILCCIFLVASANLTAHHHGLRPRVRFKKLQVVYKCGANNGVASNPNTGGLAKTRLGQQSDNFVGKRPRTRAKAYRSRFKYLVSDNPDLAITPCTHTRPAWTHPPSPFLPHHHHTP